VISDLYKMLNRSKELKFNF